MTIEYLTYLPDKYQTAALELYLGSLNDIFEPILGPVDRSQNALRDGLDPLKGLVAIKDDTLVGILGMGTSRGGFLNPTLKSMIQSYGLFGGTYRLAGLAAIHHPTRQKEIYVDGIAVSETARRQGIGSHLFKMLEEVALKKEYHEITLEVVDTNPKARALYERLGFTATRSKKIWPLGVFFKFQFQSTTLMMKSIP